MDWSEHTIWWHLQPLGFLGAEREAVTQGAVRHRLPRLRDWLDHLVELGCNGLALGPVFAAESHGYDTIDHFRVDERLGTEQDLVDLVDAARRRGVHVLLDGVFNHVGRSFAPFADLLEKGPNSPYAGWFHKDEGTGEYRTFEGHERLVELNHGDPAVVDHVVEVMSYWCDRGIAGWRLDAAYVVPMDFWREVTARVRARHPDAWLVGEVIHGDYAPYVIGGGLDSVTQYELWKAIWSSLNDRNLFELAWTMGRHNELLDVFAPQTFVGNHDVTRLASRLDDVRHVEHALVLLLTLGGIPWIYAGDERALHGIKEEREGGDDAIRPAFPETPAEMEGEGAPTLDLHRFLIGLRRRHPWTVRARSVVHDLENTSLVYSVADPEASTRRLCIALNIGDEPVTLDLPDGDWRSEGGAGEFGQAQVRLPAASWGIAVAVA